MRFRVLSPVSPLTYGDKTVRVQLETAAPPVFGKELRHGQIVSRAFAHRLASPGIPYHRSSSPQKPGLITTKNPENARDKKPIFSRA